MCVYIVTTYMEVESLNILNVKDVISETVSLALLKISTSTETAGLAKLQQDQVRQLKVSIFPPASV